MIAEQKERHVCDWASLPIEGCEEITLDRLSDSGLQKNGDRLYLAWGLDNVLYRLIVCKHNPPHTTKRIVTDLDEDDTKRRGDVTLRNKIYIWLLLKVTKYSVR